VGVREGEKVRKQVEEERKSRLETIKLRPEDKRWAEQNRKSGDSGLFQGMIVRFRSSLPAVAPPPPPPSESRIAVFVRARPLLEHELKAGGFGVVTAGSSEVSSSLVMHEPKTMVDLSKAMDNHTYRFDAVFGELATNEQIFVQALRPMVRALFGTRNGHGTCFAYGQTGSGKTVTMEGLGERARHPGNAAGLYRLVAEEIFRCVAEAAGHGQTLIVRAGFFEIYRGKCYDLLAKKRKYEVIEDEQSSDCL
jgi:kinesin family protein 2/24